MGVREGVMGVVVLLGAYVVYVLLKLGLLAWRRRRPKPEPVPEYEPDVGVYAPIPAKANTLREDDSAAPQKKREPASGHEGFESMVELARLRFQLEALTAAHAELQTELQGELALLREQVEVLRNARNVAPQYGEALGLVQRGLDSDAIAERCGISVSEAELVAALSRSSPQKE